ncbi:hypothetical protein [Virgibacillus sp. YIM 98842]|uniref:hypothetical protein n=1 Tax=Virgibacillus sp. YIM 98842 TaxID=2663533 RepID=UPI0013DC045A|nr:hypothetical protein [Virgibacillus sp. YIM 98842]
MPYLTYEEFTDLSNVEINDTEFNSLLKKASAILNNVTGYFYVRNSIETDNEWRVQQFKQALAAQIEYFHEVGGTSYEAINKTPQTFSAGRTRVTNAESRAGNTSKSMVAEDVYIYLEDTGLLYAGVSVW